MSRAHRAYDREYRDNIVKLRQGGRSAQELSKEFGPSAQTIRNWVAQAERDSGLRTDGLSSAEKEELQSLRREVKRLRMEREILSKAAAWFAHETDALGNKKRSRS